MTEHVVCESNCVHDMVIDDRLRDILMQRRMAISEMRFCASAANTASGKGAATGLHANQRANMIQSELRSPGREDCGIIRLRESWRRLMRR
jgi:hypothetical protein